VNLNHIPPFFFVKMKNRGDVKKLDKRAEKGYYSHVFQAIYTIILEAIQMIRANITEIKNRLSHYLRLVKGGEEIEIMDRKTPLARIVGTSDSWDMRKGAPWIKKMHDLGIVMPPKKKRGSLDFSNIENIISSDGNACGVLNALLEERDTGR